MDTDLDTLATALYVTCDDLLATYPEHRPWRPVGGFDPAISDRDDHPGSDLSTAGLHQ